MLLLVFLRELQTVSTLQEKMEYRLDEKTRDMHDILQSCQTKASNADLSVYSNSLLLLCHYYSLYIKQ